MSGGARLRSIQRCVRRPSQARPTVVPMRRARLARAARESVGALSAIALPEFRRLLGTAPRADQRVGVLGLERLAGREPPGWVVRTLDPARRRELEQVAVAEVLVDELLAGEEADTRARDLGEEPRLHESLELVGVAVLGHARLQ